MRGNKPHRIYRSHGLEVQLLINLKGEVSAIDIFEEERHLARVWTRHTKRLKKEIEDLLTKEE